MLDELSHDSSDVYVKDLDRVRAIEAQRLTSVPGSRDAPHNETNSWYFEFTWL